MAIHSQQGPKPTPGVAITIPESSKVSPDSPTSADPPELSNQRPAAAEPVVPPDASESKPPRSSRAKAIWGLAVTSLSPGIVVGVAPAFWHGLPTWAQWSAYAVSGVLMLLVVGLIVTPRRATE
ncbi:MAG TPA: hypothetical protein VFB89_13555 [Gemmatimonadales bacterium]|nr:hypothetical protein [Gemmatimonadales bacterium]